MNSETLLADFEAHSLTISFLCFLVRVLYWEIIIFLRKFLFLSFIFWIWFYLKNSNTLLLGSLLVFCTGRLLYAWGSFYFEFQYQVLLFWIWFYLVDSDALLPGFEVLSLSIPFSGFLIRVLYWLIIICLRNFLSWNFDFNFNSLFCFLWIWFYLMNSETLLAWFSSPLIIIIITLFRVPYLSSILVGYHMLQKVSILKFQFQFRYQLLLFEFDFIFLMWIVIRSRGICNFCLKFHYLYCNYGLLFSCSMKFTLSLF